MSHILPVHVASHRQRQPGTAGGTAAAPHQQGWPIAQQAHLQRMQHTSKVQYLSRHQAPPDIAFCGVPQYIAKASRHNMAVNFLKIGSPLSLASDMSAVASDTCQWPSSAARANLSSVLGRHVTPSYVSCLYIPFHMIQKPRLGGLGHTSEHASCLRAAVVSPPACHTFELFQVTQLASASPT
jgi:hypothetical protein